MEILKLVITVLFVIAALAIIVVVLLQEGKSAGLGSLNGSTGNDSYWEKNKKNSLEGKFERWTKITAGMFVVFALALMILNSNGRVAQVEQTPATNTEVQTENTEVQTEQNAEVQTEGETQTETTPESTDAAAADTTNGAEADSATSSN